MAKKKNSTPIETKIEQTIDITTSEESVDIDVSFDDSDETIDLAFDNAMDEIDEQKDLKDKALKEKASKKRQVVELTKKELGIRTPKQSKFPTQSDDFLSKPVSDRAIHVILNQHMSKIYLDGVDFAPRILMGIMSRMLMVNIQEMNMVIE